MYRKIIERAAVITVAFAIMSVAAIVGKTYANNQEEPVVVVQEDQADDDSGDLQVQDSEDAQLLLSAGVLRSLGVLLLDFDNETAVKDIAQWGVTASLLDEEEVSEEWANRLMPNVSSALNVRAEADAESELVGKMYPGSVAEILELGEEWTLISSGNVEGYVKNEYCLFGAEAEAYAYEIATLYATVTTKTLRVRASASTEASVLKKLSLGDTIEVNIDAEEVEGWVAVYCSGKTGYVSADYVTVELDLDVAMTVAEIKAAAKAAAEAKAASSTKVSAETLAAYKATAATYDELTLLAALIQCEAGGESYEGKVAVGAVVMNRLAYGGFGNSIIDVIFQKGQFSPASSGSLIRRLSKGVSESCLKAAKEAMSGVDNTGGCLYFRTVKSGKTGLIIGNHVFY